ncbi:MAG: TolC family protein [Bacteroidales bacterium]|nr:TolC family protein [Candidatus Colicola faecequi]
MTNSYKFYLLVAVMVAGMSARAESEFDRWLHLVAEHNSGYIAEKYNIDMAIANKQAAKVFNDPEISFDYGNNQDWNLRMGQTYEVGLSYTISTGNERGARIKVAESELAMTEAAVADYLCQLKYEATEAYATAWIAWKRFLVAEQSYRTMQRIADADSIRLSIGDIEAAEALRSHIEAQTLRGEWMLAKAEYTNALSRLRTFTGGIGIEQPANLLNTDEAPLPTSEEVLLEEALHNRSDLRTAWLQQRLSEANLRLAKASMAPSLTLNAGYVHSREVRNELAPAPLFNGFSVGVSMPIPFSAANKAGRKAAEHEIAQSEAYYQAAEEQLRADVEQAYNNCIARKAILETYSARLLSELDRVLQGHIQGYEAGESELLELLEAQDTYNEQMKVYYEYVGEAFIAEAALRRAVGR